MKHGYETQARLGLIGGTQNGGIVDLPGHVVARCRTFKHAMWEAVLACPYDVEQVAGMIGYDNHSTLSRIMNVKKQSGKGARTLPDDKWMAFCQATGNRAIYQWREMECRGELDHQRTDKEQRRTQLLAELAELESA